MQPINDYFFHFVDVLTPDLVGSGHSSAPIVYHRIVRETVGRARKTVALSLRRLVELTGLSKSAVQGAIRFLIDRGLIARVKGTTPTSTSEYRILKPWRRK